MVVTTPGDPAVEIARDNDCNVFQTTAFYEDGAVFNKFRALEYGLDAFGRRGWLVVMDSDVLWPKSIPQTNLEVGKLYSPLRRMFPSLPKEAPPEEEWSRYPIHRNVAEWAGYSQIYSTEDPALGNPPWHETNWTTAGGPDSFFQRKWAPGEKVRPPFDVLHLGPHGTNWCGRVSSYADGTKPEMSDERNRRLHQLMYERRLRRNFSAEKIKTTE